jgi:transposase-like protein
MNPNTEQNPESVVRQIKRNTCRKFNSEEKIRIILKELQEKNSIANICRKAGWLINMLIPVPEIVN